MYTRARANWQTNKKRGNKMYAEKIEREINALKTVAELDEYFRTTLQDTGLESEFYRSCKKNLASYIERKKSRREGIEMLKNKTKHQIARRQLMRALKKMCQDLKQEPTTEILLAIVCVGETMEWLDKTTRTPPPNTQG